MRILPFPTFAAGLLCAAGLLRAAGAAAQTFSGFGPAGVLTVPQAADPAQAPPATARQPVLAPDAAPAPAPALRHLPSVAASLRLWGENGEITWTLSVTEAEARAGGSFQLGYRAAVSVLPEASVLTLRLNGAVVGGTPVEGGKGLRTVRFDLPPGALSRGVNAVRVSVAQRHRVDCSVAATYELWTQVDPGSTGFVSAASGLENVADLAAARVAADGAVPIRLLQTGDRLSERVVERLIAALQEVVLTGRFSQPAADFGPVAEAGDGIALAVGTAEQLAGRLDLGTLGPVTGPRLAMLPGSAGRRPVLVVTGATDPEVALALAQLARLRAQAPLGTPEGLRARADAGGRRVEGAETITLADLGIADAHVSARTHRVAFDLALPHDVLAADYDRLTLDLDAAYPAGLAAGAQVSVEVNGVVAGSTPLARAHGESFRRRTLFLPLRLLRPGLNHIAIVAAMPREEDEACPDETAPAPERLALYATTRLTIPALARIARQPDLAGTLSAGFPYAQAARRPTLNVPAPDRDSMAAAATLAARLGFAAGRAIPFAFAAGRAVGTGPTLVVSPARLLDAQTVLAAGLEPQAVRDAWSGRESQPAAPTDPAAARRGALRAGSVAACRSRPANPADPTVPSGAGPDLGGASAVLSQAVTGPADDDLVTLVTAPSAAALREAVDCLVHPQVWNRPEGRQAVLSASDGTVASRWDDAPRYVATAAFSPMNLRRIAAGWLSLHAGFYGLFALMLAGGLAGSTQLLVRNLGRRSK